MKWVAVMVSTLFLSVAIVVSSVLVVQERQRTATCNQLAEFGRARIARTDRNYTFPEYSYYEQCVPNLLPTPTPSKR